MINRRLIFLFALAPAMVCGQSVKLDTLDKLADKASEAVTVEPGWKLAAIGQPLSLQRRSGPGADQEIGSQLEGGLCPELRVSRRSGEYQASDLEPIRSQLKDPKWKKIVEVRGRDNAEVLLRQENEHVISGLAVIVAEAKELTVVYIDGPIDMDGLSKLAGNFGIPEDIGSKVEKEKDRDKDKEKKAK